MDNNRSNSSEHHQQRKKGRSSVVIDLSPIRLQVMKTYWEVRTYYEKKKVARDGLNAFKKAREKAAAASARLSSSYSEIAPLNLRELAPIKDRPMALLRRADTNAVVGKCPIIPLAHVEATPQMQYWTHTEVNINAEDEFTLSHIPFLGDAEDDTSFCADLMTTFPDGIHGTQEGCGQYINDYILYYTVKRVQENLPDTSLKTVFKVIHEQFPNKASEHELCSMYPDLQKRFEPDKIAQQVFTNEQGELVANFSNSRLLNSYELLMCHKCFSYDCVMHNATVHNGYGDSTKTRKRPNVSHNLMAKENYQKVRQPCSEKCYMNIGLVGKKNQQKGNHNHPLSVDSSQGHAKWTPHDESIFNVLRSTGEDEYCRIARMLNMTTSGKRKKTCQEVYEYAFRAGPLSPRLELPPSPDKGAKCRKDNHRHFRAMKWAYTDGKVENHGRFQPCKQKCDCHSKSCHCVKVNNLCTKYCGCEDACANRFPGCRCAPGNCRTKQCQCYYASWECDPDVCKSCNCDKLDGSGEPICKNVSIQRGLQKRLIVAPSQVAGWGCFANEDIEKNDFISEYCGEVISVEESERRGKIYDRIKCSYLFGLNDEQVVDATRVGNVIRFANHSSNPNCRAKVIVVNGDHKIGIFAQRPIKCGEELFFNYAYNKTQQVAFVPKELSQILRVKEKGEGSSSAA